MELTAVIADDESMARQRVHRLLTALGVRVLAEAADGEAALAAVEEHAPDALFLDVNMPGLTGPEVAGLLGPAGPWVVFLTAHAEHAVQAFAQGAVDYVLKPIAAERLAQAVQRVRDRRGPLGSPDGRLALPTADGAVLVELERISHAQIDGESVVLFVDGRKRFTDLRLADLERRLGTGFLRIHRQCLVNLAFVERLEDVDSGGYLAHLRGGPSVAVSRAAARQLRKAWGLPR